MVTCTYMRTCACLLEQPRRLNIEGAMGSPARAPEDFKDDLAAKLTPFYKGWANELGGSPGNRLLVLKDLIKSRFGRARLRGMLKLTDLQFEALLVEAGCDPYLRLVTEEHLSASFARAQVPSSAALVPAISRTSYADSAVRQEKKGKKGTVSALLESYDGELLPCEVLAVITTPNIGANPISIPDLNAATTEILASFFCEHGTLAMGANLVRRKAAQMRLHVPNLPSRKKKLCTWDNSIGHKVENWGRPDATVRRHCHCIARCP
jgi:hypothetical protein